MGLPSYLTLKAIVRNLFSVLIAVSLYLLYLFIYLYQNSEFAVDIVSMFLFFSISFRLLQIVLKFQNLKSLIRIKHLIRIFLFVSLVVAQCGISLKLIDNIDKDNVVVHQSGKKYILARYVISFVSYLIVHDFISQYDSGNLRTHLQLAITEIIDINVMFWEYIPTIPVMLEHMPILFSNKSQMEDILAAFLLAYDQCIIVLASMHFLIYKWKRLSAKPNQPTSTIIGEIFHRRNYAASYLFVDDLFVLLFIGVLFFEDKSKKVSELDLYKSDISKFRKISDSEAFSCTFFIFYSIWMIKNVELSIREDFTVYNRFRSRILRVSEQIYFLGILDQRQENMFNLPHIIVSEQTANEGSNNKKISLSQHIAWITILPVKVLSDFVQTSSLKSLHGANHIKRLRNLKRQRIRNDLVIGKQCCDNNNDMAVVKKVDGYILNAKYSLSSMENYMSSILNLFDSRTDDNSNIREPLQHLITWENKYEEDWEYFIKEQLKINDVNSANTPIYLKDFRAWVVKARNNVMSVANTQCSSKDVAHGLNRLISGLIIAIFGVIVVTLLKIYEYAMALQILLFIATPSCAASFFIRDTLRDLFERSFFVYAIHPFEIGDMCSIDDRRMEVTAMGIWTTTFLAMDKGGMKEDIIYPNSKLAKMKIIKIQSECDWNDSIEVDLDSKYKIDISKLKEDIKAQHLANVEKLHFD